MELRQSCRLVATVLQDLVVPVHGISSLAVEVAEAWWLLIQKREKLLCGKQQQESAFDIMLFWSFTVFSPIKLPWQPVVCLWGWCVLGQYSWNGRIFHQLKPALPWNALCVRIPVSLQFCAELQVKTGKCQCCYALDPPGKVTGPKTGKSWGNSLPKNTFCMKWQIIGSHELHSEMLRERFPLLSWRFLKTSFMKSQPFSLWDIWPKHF